MTIELAPEHIIGLWAELEARFKLRLIDKNDAEEMALIGNVLERMGVMDEKVFLEGYATTIGRSVYLPFELGNPDSRPLLSQARTISHEAQHGHQHTTKGGPVWAFNYLTDGAFRGAEEAEASTTSCEVHWLLTGDVLDHWASARKLRHYALEQKDIDTVGNRLKSAFKTVKAGGIVTPAGKVSKAYFESVSLI